MKADTHNLKFKDFPTDYAGLMGVLMLRPIHDDVDLGNMIEVASEMAGHELSKDQADYLELLSTLIQEYESKNRAPRAKRTPLSRLKYVMKESKMKTADLGRLLGNSGLATLILQGKRELSKQHIRILAAHFKVEPGYFL